MPEVNDTRTKVGARHAVRGRGIAYATCSAIDAIFDAAGTGTIDLSTIRVALEVADPLVADTFVRVTARLCGPNPDECPSCHAHAGHPHTDYCQRTDPAPKLRAEVDRIHQHLADEATPEPWSTPPADALAWVAEDNAQRARDLPPVPVHRCTDPTCPVHGPHAHAGTDVLMRHPDCTCQFLNAYRTWYAPSFHTRPGCPLADPAHADHAWPSNPPPFHSTPPTP